MTDSPDTKRANDGSLTTEEPHEGLRYSDSGVDIRVADNVVAGIRAIEAGRYNPNVIGGLGHFGGFFRLGAGGTGTTLVASIDGVGTKVLLAQLASRYGGIGADLVHHCVNDILACGAQPLFFLDYFGTGKLNPETALAVIESMSNACAQMGIALLGGETAEMPGLYQGDDFDLVGAIVGVVQEDGIVDGSKIEAGDLVLGIPSNGFHTNGYSLIRAALRLNDSRLAWEHLSAPASFDPSETLAEALLRPHRSYRTEVARMLTTDAILGMAHITGGGLPGNVSRIIPDGLAAGIDTSTWEVPSMFEYVAEAGHISRDECFSAFNMGIGFAVVCRERDVAKVLQEVPDAIVIGQIERASDGQKVRLSVSSG